ncbi:hypothetical protein GQX74_007517 [Glossina fuscipes]|nr:hypothetical protein GQX74_007517 [Glossina fuscipes]
MSMQELKAFTMNFPVLTNLHILYEHLQTRGCHLRLEVMRRQLSFEAEGFPVVVQGKVTSIRYYQRHIMTQEIEKELCWKRRSGIETTDHITAEWHKVVRRTLSSGEGVDSGAILYSKVETNT